MTVSSVKFDESDQEPAASREPLGRRLYAWYVAVALMLVYTLSFIDRKLPFILAESIKRDLHLSDTQLGLLTGLAFTLVYAVVALPIAKLADRGPRKLIIVAAVGVWSVMTAAGGLASNFLQLAVSRGGVAIGESACTPAAHSLLGDSFPDKRRSSALALYMLGAPLGILLGLWFGGMVADLRSWRFAMFAVGLPGLTLAMIVAFTVREPARQKVAEPLSAPSMWDTVRVVFASPVLRHMLWAGALATAGNGAVNAFGPAYMIRSFGLSTATTGMLMGLVSGGGGMAGALIGGALGDYLRTRAPHQALWVVGVGFIISGPLTILAFGASGLTAFLTFLFLPLALSMLYAGPCYATLQGLVPLGMRSMATAIYLFALNGVGLSVGPFLAGAISDALRPHLGVESLRFALGILAFTKIWGGIHYLIAGSKLRAHNASPA